MVPAPTTATSLPSICFLDPAEINALKLTLNECLQSPSCRQYGYHILFTLLFCLHFYKLDSVVQQDALKEIIKQSHSLSISSSSSSSSSPNRWFPPPLLLSVQSKKFLKPKEPNNESQGQDNNKYGIHILSRE